MSGSTQPVRFEPQQPSAADRLDSWKEIAVYLKRSVRSVRRWESEEGLPVHRHQHQSSGTVYAFKAELDAWWANRSAELGSSDAAAEEAATAAPTIASKLQWIVESGSQASATAPDASHGKLRERIGWVAATALSVIAIIATASWWRAARPIVHPLIRMEAELATGPEGTYRIDDTLLVSRGTGTFLALSPNGSRLVVEIRDTDGNVRLATRRLDENQFKALPGSENPLSPFFSPNGQWIAFFADGKLRKIPVQGGPPVVVCDAKEGFSSGSWGDDDNIIAALESHGPLSQVPSTGGIPTPVTELNRDELWHRWPQVLPGSQAVLFTASRGGGPEGRSIDILSFKTHERKTLVRGGTMGRYLAASNGAGYLIYVDQGKLFAVPLDIGSLAIAGTAQPILDDITTITAVSPGDFDFSRNGTFVYIRGNFRLEPSIFWLDHLGKAVPLRPPGFYSTLRFSPGGKDFLFVTRGEGHNNNLWVQELERNAVTRLASLPGSIQSPVWSTDGKSVLFSVEQQLNSGLYWVRSGGEGEPQRVAEPATGRPSSFLPDGKRLALQRGSMLTAMGVEVWIAPVEGTPDHPQIGTGELFVRSSRAWAAPAFSPDGRWLAYCSAETGIAEIYVKPFPGPGGKLPISTGGGEWPIWSPNGRELFFLGLDHRIMVVDYMARDGPFSPVKPRVWSQQQILFDPTGGPFQPYALAPDGKRFAVALYPDRKTEQHNPLHLTFLLNFTDELRRRVSGE